MFGMKSLCIEMIGSVGFLVGVRLVEAYVAEEYECISQLGNCSVWTRSMMVRAIHRQLDLVVSTSEIRPKPRSLICPNVTFLWSRIDRILFASDASSAVSCIFY